MQPTPRSDGEGIGPLDIPIITRASNVNPRREQQRISTYKQYPLIFAEFNLGRHPRSRSLLPDGLPRTYVRTYLGGTGRCFVTRNFVTRPAAGSGGIVGLREFRRRRYDRLAAVRLVRWSKICRVKYNRNNPDNISPPILSLCLFASFFFVKGRTARFRMSFHVVRDRSPKSAIIDTRACKPFARIRETDSGVREICEQS